MTNMEAFNLAKIEIETFGFEVNKVRLKLPTEVPEGRFFALFQNPKTKQTLFRTYRYEQEKPTVSFVEIVNPDSIRAQNEPLFKAYLENGRFLYRNSVTYTEKLSRPKTNKDGTISLSVTKMVSIPL